jgi:hypothetical protein
VVKTRHVVVVRTHHVCGPCGSWWRTRRPDAVISYEPSPALVAALTVAQRVYDVLDSGDLPPAERGAAALDVLLEGVPQVTRPDPQAPDFVVLAEAIQAWPDAAAVRAWAAGYGLVLRESGAGDGSARRPS